MLGLGTRRLEMSDVDELTSNTVSPSPFLRWYLQFDGHDWPLSVGDRAGSHADCYWDGVSWVDDGADRFEDMPVLSLRFQSEYGVYQKQICPSDPARTEWVPLSSPSEIMEVQYPKRSYVNA